MRIPQLEPMQAVVIGITIFVVMTAIGLMVKGVG